MGTFCQSYYFTYPQSLYADSTRRKGDDTLRYYSGDLKQLLILVQLSCRKVIATEDAFPCPMQFSSLVERIFGQKVQQLLQKKSKFMLKSSQVC